MSETCREKILLEEINDLEIEEFLKKRLVDKCESMMKELDEHKAWLKNCHEYQYRADSRIQDLETTLANMCVTQFGKSEWQYKE